MKRIHYLANAVILVCVHLIACLSFYIYYITKNIKSHCV